MAGHHGAVTADAARRLAIEEVVEKTGDACRGEATSGGVVFAGLFAAERQRANSNARKENVKFGFGRPCVGCVGRKAERENERRLRPKVRPRVSTAMMEPTNVICATTLFWLQWEAARDMRETPRTKSLAARFSIRSRTHRSVPMRRPACASPTRRWRKRRVPLQQAPGPDHARRREFAKPRRGPQPQLPSA